METTAYSKSQSSNNTKVIPIITSKYYSSADTQATFPSKDQAIIFNAVEKARYQDWLLQLSPPHLDYQIKESVCT